MRRIEDLVNIYLKDVSGNLNILGKGIKIAIILLAAKVISSLTNRIIDRALLNRKESNFFSVSKRAHTIGELLKKVVRYALYFIAVISILDIFNINTTSILATAGIGGLAIGFGAQSLVKDVITGFFIFIEDQYAVGDYIKLDSLEGTVEEMGLRVTKLRAFSGELHIIPNGKIQVVTNSTRGAMRALVVISAPYEEDADKVIDILEEVCQDIKSANDAVLEGPTVLGITDLAEDYISITIVAKTKPMSQWSVEREIRKKAKEAFNRENIEIPYRKVVIFGGNEDA
ncbi:MAG: mechanosensitive ion channel family protein [Tissierellaceae bacterium]|nr:mechanosensitive ion channel family protein [Tissierellaceae bacterium]